MHPLTVNIRQHKRTLATIFMPYPYIHTNCNCFYHTGNTYYDKYRVNKKQLWRVSRSSQYPNHICFESDMWPTWFLHGSATWSCAHENCKMEIKQFDKHSFRTCNHFLNKYHMHKVWWEAEPCGNYC